MNREEATLGIFTSGDDLLSALRELRGKGYPIQEVYSPIPLEEVSQALSLKPSIIRAITLAGGILGGSSLVALGAYAHSSFHLITSGKPIIPPIPFVIVFFEGLVLLAVIFTVAAWILEGRLPRVHFPRGYDRRFSQDRFGIVVPAAPGTNEEISRILKQAGAEEVLHVPP
jgi:hypothetical protein